MEYLWDKKGIPHTGWTYLNVYDYFEQNDDYFTCEMCGYERVRYVHVLWHPDYGEISVGCVCAGNLVGDIEYARNEEKGYKKEQRKKKSEMKRKKKEEERLQKLEEARLQKEENERKRLEDLKIKRLAYLKRDLYNLEYNFNPRKNTYTARIHKELVTIKLTVNGTYGYVFRNKWVWNLRTLGYAKQRVRDDLFNILMEEC